MKFEQLIILIVVGVIVADFVSHVAGTQALFEGFRTLWSIGINPTDTAAIRTTPMANSAERPIKK